MPRRKPKTTRWLAVTWQRTYRDVAIWVEEMFSVSPKWSWNVQDGTEGRSKTKLAAMKAAQRAVDTALKESEATK